MLSVLVLGFDSVGRRPAQPGEAVRTVASLVPATVDGVVRDLCLAGPAGSGLAEIAEHAGSAFVPIASVFEALQAGARTVRQAQVLVVQAGMMVDRAVIEEFATLLPLLDGPNPGAWVLKADRRDLLGRLFPAFASTVGLICPRALLLHTKADSLATLARRAGRRRTMRTRALLGP